MKKLFPLALFAFIAPGTLALATPAADVTPTVTTEEVALVETAEDVVDVDTATELPVYAGYEQDWQNAHDEMIVRVVGEFNAQKGWDENHPNHLDPAIVKAWALQESGSHREIFSQGDMMQMNNDGDWADEKTWFGIERGEQLTPEESLRAALDWAYYKAEETRPMTGSTPDPGWYPTVRNGEVLPGYQSRFTNWDKGLTDYNGGGVADYLGDIERRMDRVA